MITLSQRTHLSLALDLGWFSEEAGMAPKFLGFRVPPRGVPALAGSEARPAPRWALRVSWSV